MGNLVNSSKPQFIILSKGIHKFNVSLGKVKTLLDESFWRYFSFDISGRCQFMN